MKRKATEAKITIILMAAAGLFFLQDVVFDVWHHATSHVPYTSSELLHLLFEAFAVVVLALSVWQLTAYTRHLEKHNQTQQELLQNLRDDFDNLVQKRFKEWKLTPSEADVTLLVLRGLSTEKIAEIRSVASGTVKAQAHSAMQKAGTNSRIEMMALFIDEFMGVGFHNQSKAY